MIQQNKTDHTYLIDDIFYHLDQIAMIVIKMDGKYKNRSKIPGNLRRYGSPGKAKSGSDLYDREGEVQWELMLELIFNEHNKPLPVRTVVNVIMKEYPNAIPIQLLDAIGYINRKLQKLKEADFIFFVEIDMVKHIGLTQWNSDKTVDYCIDS